MKLYFIWQNVNDNYDTYDSAVVAAETEYKARHTHPSGDGRVTIGEWASPKDVRVRLIGEAAAGVEAGVICASFNAG